MFKLDFCTVGDLIERMKPGSTSFDYWSCSESVKAQLYTLSEDTWITCYGDMNFKLGNDYGSYYVHTIYVKI